MIISDVSNINKRSSILIDVQCDICAKNLTIKYINYTRNGNKDGFYLCKTCKTKNTNLEKWGVENPSQLEEVKEKRKRTLLENWGVDHPSKSEEIKEKKRTSFQENWGVDHPFQSSEIKQRIKITNLDRLGVVNPSQSEEIKEKKRQTLLENWGVDHPLKSEEVKEKIINNNLRKWKVKYVLQNDLVKEKIKLTNIERLGVDNPMKSETIKENIKKTNLEKWGVEYFYQTSEFKRKSDLKKIDKYGNSSYKRSLEFYKKTIIGNDTMFIEYIGDSISKFNCKNGHSFEIKSDNYHSLLALGISLCTICNPIGDQKSIKEKELYELIKSIYDGEIIKSYRDGLEIDVYLPDLKLGFEFNGLYYHSNKFKERNYHLNKTEWFHERGIRIIHIWEDDWTNKREIIKSQISNLLLKTKFKIFARECKIIQLSSVSDFLYENHIQGSDYSKIKLGLFYNGELVSAMTFNKLEGRKCMCDGEWNLSRFCNKRDYSVIGSASKLLNYFIKCNNPKRIISYADRDWSRGDLYNKLGFRLINVSKSDYKYLLDGIRVNKSRFRRSRTGKLESEIDIPIVWDCGKLKFEIIID